MHPFVDSRKQTSLSSSDWVSTCPYKIILFHNEKRRSGISCFEGKSQLIASVPMYIVLLNQSKSDYHKHSDDRKAIPMLSMRGKSITSSNQMRYRKARNSPSGSIG